MAEALLESLSARGGEYPGTLGLHRGFEVLLGAVGAEVESESSDAARLYPPLADWLAARGRGDEAAELRASVGE